MERKDEVDQAREMAARYMIRNEALEAKLAKSQKHVGRLKLALRAYIEKYELALQRAEAAEAPKEG